MFSALLLSAAMSTASQSLVGLRTAIVGGGPAGLLLAHRLLGSGASVRLFEARQDPRVDGVQEGRAYALGLGLRGRTAIRAVDETLWEKVREQGYGSDRFTLHLPFGAFDLRKPDGRTEPSVLIYQTDLCSAMLNELELRYKDTGRLTMSFNAPLEANAVDPVGGTLSTDRFDLIAGCDGVQSAVRGSMVAAAADLPVETTKLPGSLKVVRLKKMPAALSSNAVHLVPGAGGVAAFLEPTAQGVCALVSWRGATSSGGSGGDGASAAPVDPAAITDAEEATQLLASSFPTLTDAFNLTDVGEQFVAQRVSTASTVKCASYHLGKACLLGDAAHSTGGASGQGCNSALQDAIVLAECLERFKGDVAPAIVAYSRERVPEGHAYAHNGI